MFIVLFGWKLRTRSALEKCVSILIPELADCKEGKGLNLTHNMECVNNDICNKTFNVSIIRLEPLSTMLFPNFLKYMLGVCCSKCAIISVMNRFNDTRELNVSAISSSDFVFPVLGYLKSMQLYGYHYIPIMQTPDIFFISNMKSTRIIVESLIESSTNIWPLLVICLLMTFIVGFFIWLIETWQNKNEFPRPFFIGLFEGFWWAFISMTTVGYGDKAPKFFLSRIIAVVWILIGITMISIFTADLSTEIASVTTSTTPTMTNSKIGVLKGRIYDASIVTNGGGYVEVTEDGALLPGFFELINKLRNGSIAGFLLDKPAYMDIQRSSIHIVNQPNHKRKDVALFFLNDTLRTKLEWVGEPLSYGILVKQTKDYEYFKYFVMDNHLIFKTCTQLQASQSRNQIIDHKPNNIFTTQTEAFTIALTITLLTLGAIILIGLIYELARWLLRGRRSQGETAEG